MMFANYHSHTFRCHHADGTEREYIEAAIKGGIKVLGFSDHSPYLFDDGYYSDYRMRPEETEGYLRTITDLKEEYRDDIEIHVGVEMEYYGRYFEKTVRFLSDFPCEYLILGQHYLDSENGSIRTYPGFPTGDPALFRRYIDEAIAGVRTGLFTYLAHPDLCPFIGDPEIYVSEYRRLCRALKETGTPGEINLLGISGNRRYPSPLFWKTAGEEKIRTVIGADAHTAGALFDEASYGKALKIASSNGLFAENADAPVKLIDFKKKI
ncbi:MAG: histidinol-phosphatase [Clostridia bacterium]|nr:histidinol-phosphatase [Clostridia bacterium]